MTAVLCADPTRLLCFGFWTRQVRLLVGQSVCWITVYFHLKNLLCELPHLKDVAWVADLVFAVMPHMNFFQRL